MDAQNTRAWVDLYSLVLDRLAEFLADPVKRALKMGITVEELRQQEQGLPKQMILEKYKEQQDSWKNVSREILAFDLKLGDDLLLAPEMKDMATKQWKAAPWLFVFRETDKTPLKFYGRDAFTAMGFFNFFINQCEQVDPRLRIRQELEAQGINAENFRERMFGTSVVNPWEDLHKPIDPVEPPPTIPPSPSP